LILQGNNFNVAILDKADGRGRFTLGSTAGTGAGKLYAGDSLYIGTTLALDASRNASLGTVASGAITATGNITVSKSNAALVLGDGSNNLSFVNFIQQSLRNWRIGPGSVNNGWMEFIPSTATGNTTFSNPVLAFDTLGLFRFGIGNTTTSAAFTFKGRNDKANLFELYRSASATAVATVDTNGVPDFPNALVSGVIVGDSVRVAVPGLTTATGDAVVCYRMAASAAPDTLPSFRINAAGYITLTGKHGYTVKAFVGRK
jgi:hypothetical protein